MKINSKAFAILGGATILAICGVTPPALAQETSASGGQLYFGVGPSVLGVEDALGETSYLGVGLARLGYRFTTNVGLEGEFGGGLGLEMGEVGATDIEVGSYWSGFGVLFLPVGTGWDVFVRGGLASLDVSGLFGGVAEDSGDPEFGFGAGLIGKAGPVELRLDVTHYEFDGGSANAGSFTIGARF